MTQIVKNDNYHIASNMVKTNGGAPDLLDIDQIVNEATGRTTPHTNGSQPVQPAAPIAAIPPTFQATAQLTFFELSRALRKKSEKNN